MKASNRTLAQVKGLLSEILKKYPENAENSVMTDISFQAKSDTGELSALNDDDEMIASVTVDDWIDNQDDNFEESVASLLRRMLTERKADLEAASILKPYSFLLVDEDHETLTELYLVDDNTVIVEDEELMKGLDKDLDNFLDKLLSE